MLFGGIDIPGRPDLDNIRKLDLLPIPMIRRMQRYGFAIDIPYLNDLTSQFEVEMRDLERDIASYIPADRLDEFSGRSAAIEAEEGDATINAASAEQIHTLLFEILGVGKDRKLKKTKAGDRYSTGKKQLELLHADHPVVRKVLDYRERAKLKSTYTTKLPKIARFHPRSVGKHTCPVCEMNHRGDTWRVHTEIVTTRAETGRLASRNPNLQNIPARTELGALVRAAFIASPGTLLLSSDLSQIELRDLAHCADAASMKKVYWDGKDIHVYTACEAFGKDYDYFAALLKKKKHELTGQEKGILDDFKLNCRMPSKNLNFMIVYGATVVGLLAQMALSGLYWTEEEGLAFIERWFNLYPEVREYMDLLYYLAKKYKMVWDQLGRIRLTPEVESFHSWILAAGLRQGGNMPIQSLAAGQFKIGTGIMERRFLQFLDDGDWCWPLVPVHDEVLAEADENCAHKVAKGMVDSFEEVMVDQDTREYRFRVPIKAEMAVTSRWIKD